MLPKIGRVVMLPKIGADPNRNEGDGPIFVAAIELLDQVMLC
jgi:hypothetical protein